MLNEVLGVKAIRPVDLRSRQREFLDMAYNGEILIVARPFQKNVVVLSEAEFNKRETALKNVEYLAKLDGAVEDVRENGGYEFDIATKKFSDMLQKVDI
ncbi:hypothetical protein FACS189490_12690 [Clostridia bacterium]|nr:hypothetical protein FACS189490_12690 [Clostridia bacterium]